MAHWFEKTALCSALIRHGGWITRQDPEKLQGSAGFPMGLNYGIMQMTGQEDGNKENTGRPVPVKGMAGLLEG